MTQDRQSGAAANLWGHKTAARIMRCLGVKGISSNSNECRFWGEIVVIKCSASKTGGVGVSYLMLERIAAVIGAFTRNSTQFDLYRLSSEDYERHMTPTLSKGPSSGKVGIVRKNVFLQLGKHLGVIDIGKTK